VIYPYSIVYTGIHNQEKKMEYFFLDFVLKREVEWQKFC